MNLKKALISLLILPAMLMAADKSLDIAVSQNTKNSAAVGVSGKVVLPFNKNSALLINPRVIGTVDGEFDFSAGMGYRHMIGAQVFGINAFWDHTRAGKFKAHQVGYGLEYFRGKWGFRHNFYYPVTSTVVRTSEYFEPNLWTEATANYRFRWFTVLAGPTYNFSSHKWGVKGGISVPLNHFSIGLSSAYTYKNTPSACLSISFGLYDVKEAPQFGHSIIRSSRIRHMRFAIEKPVIPEPAPVIPEEPVKEEPRPLTWWEWFFGAGVTGGAVYDGYNGPSGGWSGSDSSSGNSSAPAHQPPAGPPTPMGGPSLNGEPSPQPSPEPGYRPSPGAIPDSPEGGHRSVDNSPGDCKSVDHDAGEFAGSTSSAPSASAAAGAAASSSTSSSTSSAVGSSTSSASEGSISVSISDSPGAAISTDSPSGSDSGDWVMEGTDE